MLMIQEITDKLLFNLDEGMMKRWLNAVLPDVMAFFWSVVLALIAFVIGRRLIRKIVDLTDRGMEKKRIEHGIRTFTRSLLNGALYLLLLVIILNLFGISTSSIAAAVATLGFTAGFSLQGSLSNFAGGVLILMLHPFVVGDYIIEDTNKNEGTVREITIIYTKLATVDNRIVVIPNGMLANSSLTNVTKSPKRQLDLTFSISYDADIRKAKEVLRQVIAKEERRFIGEEENVFVKELSDSSVNLGMRFWVPTGSYWPIRWDTIENVKYAFDEAGIAIPYPQMDVHVDGN